MWLLQSLALCNTQHNFNQLYLSRNLIVSTHNKVNGFSGWWCFFLLVFNSCGHWFGLYSVSIRFSGWNRLQLNEIQTTQKRVTCRASYNNKTVYGSVLLWKNPDNCFQFDFQFENAMPKLYLISRTPPYFIQWPLEINYWHFLPRHRHFKIHLLTPKSILIITTHHEVAMYLYIAYMQC